MARVQIILLIMLTIQLYNMSAQEKSVNPDQFIVNLSRYRATLLLNKGSDKLHTLGHLIAQWQDHIQIEEKFEDVIFNLTYHTIFHPNDFLSFKENVKRNLIFII